MISITNFDDHVFISNYLSWVADQYDTLYADDQGTEEEFKEHALSVIHSAFAEYGADIILNEDHDAVLAVIFETEQKYNFFLLKWS